MATSNRDRILPSLLDRLTDDDPVNQSVGRGGSSMAISELRRSVLRDLNWLFNTTQLATAGELDAHPEVRNSIINYGLPALSGMAASMLDIGQLERALQQAIIDFEPRLLADTVSVKANFDQDAVDHHNVVYLQIEGMLWAQPAPIELLLRTEFDLESGQSVVAESTTRK